MALRGISVRGSVGIFNILFVLIDASGVRVILYIIQRRLRHRYSIVLGKHTHTHTHLDNIFKARDGCLILWIILHEGAWINLNRCPACNKA
jgi:hypothetical protein